MTMFTIFGLEAPILEIVMLLCFGVAWPVSIVKMVKSKRTGGKSVVFSFAILIGYISGLLNKLIFLQKFDIACFFYILNVIMVTIDMLLWFRNRRIEKAAEQQSALT